MFYRYFTNDHYFFNSQILFFIFSSRCRQRRRQQYEIFQKIFYETSLNIVNIYFFIISIQNNQTFQFIDNHHSTFTFCLILEEIHQKAYLLIDITFHWWCRTVRFIFLYLKTRFLDFERSFSHLQSQKHWNKKILKSTTIKSFRFRCFFLFFD